MDRPVPDASKNPDLNEAQYKKFINKTSDFLGVSGVAALGFLLEATEGFTRSKVIGGHLLGLALLLTVSTVPVLLLYLATKYKYRNNNKTPSEFLKMATELKQAMLNLFLKTFTTGAIVYIASNFVAPALLGPFGGHILGAYIGVSILLGLALTGANMLLSRKKLKEKSGKEIVKSFFKSWLVDSLYFLSMPLLPVSLMGSQVAFAGVHTGIDNVREGIFSYFESHDEQKMKLKEAEEDFIKVSTQQEQATLNATKSKLEEAKNELEELGRVDADSNSSIGFLKVNSIDNLRDELKEQNYLKAFDQAFPDGLTLSEALRNELKNASKQADGLSLSTFINTINEQFKDGNEKVDLTQWKTDLFYEKKELVAHLTGQLFENENTLEVSKIAAKQVLEDYRVIPNTKGKVEKFLADNQPGINQPDRRTPLLNWIKQHVKKKDEVQNELMIQDSSHQVNPQSRDGGEKLFQQFGVKQPTMKKTARNAGRVRFRRPTRQLRDAMRLRPGDSRTEVEIVEKTKQRARCVDDAVKMPLPGKEKKEMEK
jgi:hypothetical protein